MFFNEQEAFLCGNGIRWLLLMHLNRSVKGTGKLLVTKRLLFDVSGYIWPITELLLSGSSDFPME
jgi:hypothetical protein